MTLATVGLLGFAPVGLCLRLAAMLAGWAHSPHDAFADAGLVCDKCARHQRVSSCNT